MRVDRRLYLDRQGKIVTLDQREDAVVLFKARGGKVTAAELQQYHGQIERFIPELRAKAEAATKREKVAQSQAAAQPQKADESEEDKNDMAEKKSTPQRDK